MHARVWAELRSEEWKKKITFSWGNTVIKTLLLKGLFCRFINWSKCVFFWFRFSGFHWLLLRLFISYLTISSHCYFHLGLTKQSLTEVFYAILFLFHCTAQTHPSDNRVNAGVVAVNFAPAFCAQITHPQIEQRGEPLPGLWSVTLS